MRSKAGIILLALLLVQAIGIPQQAFAAVPEAVNDLQVAGIGYDKIELAWTSPNNGGSAITGYKLQIGEDPWEAISESGAATTTHIVTEMNPGTRYTIKVRAVNSDGDGSESNAVTVLSNKFMHNVPSGLVLNDDVKFGTATTLSTDGNTLAVGAPFGAGKGAVYIFTKQNDMWKYSAKVDENINGLSLTGAENFGAAVALSGDGNTLAAAGQAGVRDRVYIFTRSNNTWTHDATISEGFDGIDFESRGSVYFGSSLAVSSDGTSVYIGAEHDDNGNDEIGSRFYSFGAVYILEKNGNTWSYESSMENNPVGGIFLSTLSRFGSAMALSSDDNTLIVVADGAEAGYPGSEGEIYIFKKEDDQWVRDTLIEPSSIMGLGFGSYDGFGISAAIAGDGYHFTSGRRNHISGSSLPDEYLLDLFVKNGGTWIYHSTIEEGDIDELESHFSDENRFGTVVSLSFSGDTMFIGLYDDGIEGEGRGAVQMVKNPNFTPPIITDQSLVSDRSSDTASANVGDTLTLEFTVSEPLTADPDVVIMGQTVTISKNQNTYTATYTVTDTTREGIATYNVGILTGQDGQMSDPPRTLSSVVVDTTAPTLTNPSNIGQTASPTPGFSFDTNEAGAITYTGSCSSGYTVAMEGSNVSVFNMLSPGSYSDCALTVTDAVGNESEPLTFPQFVILGPPEAVDDLAISGIGYDTIGLSWTSPHNGGFAITGYDIRQSEGDWETIVGSDANTMTHTVTGINPHTNYVFRVRAKNIQGDGSPSNLISAVTGRVGTESPKEILQRDVSRIGRGVAITSSTNGGTLFFNEKRNNSTTDVANVVYALYKQNNLWEYGTIVDDSLLDEVDLSYSKDFGRSVAVSSDAATLAVGIPDDNTGGDNRGAVYLFYKSNGVWTYGTKIDNDFSELTLSDRDRFGESVALSDSGDMLFVGASRDGPNNTRKGAVYVFTKNSNTWEYHSKIADGVGELVLKEESFFGSSVAFSSESNMLAVGAPRRTYANIEGYRGAMYIFTDVNGVWTLNETIDDTSGHFSIPAGFGYFGNVTAFLMDGTVLMASSGITDAAIAPTGVMYVFNKYNGKWVYHSNLQQGNGLPLILQDPDHTFGRSVAGSEDDSTFIVGTTHHYTLDPPDSEGVVYIFDSTETLAPIITDFTVSSSRTNVNYGIPGDTVSVSFSVSEDLMSVPSLTIAGETVTVEKSGDEYTAVYTVTESTQEGPLVYDIGTLTDVDRQSFNPPSDEIDITIDTIAPHLIGDPEYTAEDIDGNSWSDAFIYLDEGDTIAVRYIVNENLITDSFDVMITLPDGTTATEIAMRVEDTNTFEVTFTVEDGWNALGLDVNEHLTFTIVTAPEDEAGNTLSEDDLTSQVYLTSQNYRIDTSTPPTPSDLDLVASDDTGESDTDNITQRETVTVSYALITTQAEDTSLKRIFLRDGGTDITAPSTMFSQTITLSEGDHAITAVTLDRAGNMSAESAALQITIDSRAPVVTINGEESLLLRVADTYTEQGAESDEENSVVTIGGDTIDTDTPGTYAVLYTGRDVAGNTDMKTRTVVVHEPLTVSVEDQHFPANEEWSVTLPEAVHIIGDGSYTLTGSLPTGLSFNQSTRKLSGTATQTGSFPVTYTANDSADSSSVSDSFNIIVADFSILITDDNYMSPEKTKSVLADASENTGVTETQYVIAESSVDCHAEASFTDTSPWTPGTPITVSSEDDNGKKICFRAVYLTFPHYAESNIIGGIDRTAPILTNPSDIGTTPETTPDFSFTTDEAGDISYTGECSSSATEAVMGMNMVTLNELAVGRYDTCTVSVTDAAGNESAALNVPEFVIQATPPVFAEQDIPGKTYRVGEIIEPVVLPEATGGTDPLTYAITGLPSGLTFDPSTRTISGQPDTAVMDTVVSYIVRDSEATPRTDTLVFTVTVMAFSITIQNDDYTIPEQAKEVTPTASDTAAVSGKVYVLIDGSEACDSTVSFTDAVAWVSGMAVIFLDESANGKKACFRASHFGSFHYVTSEVIGGIDTTAPQNLVVELTGVVADAFISNAEKDDTGSLITTPTSEDDNAVTYQYVLTSAATQCADAAPYAAAIPTTSSVSADGSYTVCVKAADTVGNTAYIPSVVFFKDTQAPILESQDIDTSNEFSGDRTTVGDTLIVSFSTSEALKVSPIVTIMGQPALVSAMETYYTATYMVTDTDPEVTVTYDIFPLEDFAGNTIDPPAETSHIVVDRTAPVVTLNGDAEITLNVGDTYVDQGAVSSDGGVVFVFGLDEVDTDTPGTYIVSYYQTDDAGNTDMKTRTVIVVQPEEAGEEILAIAVVDDDYTIEAPDKSVIAFFSNPSMGTNQHYVLIDRSRTCDTAVSFTNALSWMSGTPVVLSRESNNGQRICFRATLGEQTAYALSGTIGGIRAAEAGPPLLSPGDVTVVVVSDNDDPGYAVPGDIITITVYSDIIEEAPTGTFAGRIIPLTPVTPTEEEPIYEEGGVYEGTYTVTPTDPQGPMDYEVGVIYHDDETGNHQYEVVPIHISIVIDTSVPTVTSVDEIDTSKKRKVSFTFSVIYDQYYSEGPISERLKPVFGGSCSDFSADAIVIDESTVSEASNTISTTLSVHGRTYSGCTVSLIDEAGNRSSEIAVPQFTVRGSGGSFGIITGAARRGNNPFHEPDEETGSVEDTPSDNQHEGSGYSTAWPPDYNLKIGDIGENVRQLQIFLNSNGYTVSTEGPGSPGQETTYFGTLTQQALIRYQEANGIIPASGYLDEATRNHIRRVLAGEISVELPSVYHFTRDLTLGATGEDVRQLQIFLNSNGYTVSTEGPGSPGQETTYFGTLTQQALARYQAANDIAPAVGYFGPITRAQVNSALNQV